MKRIILVLLIIGAVALSLWLYLRYQQKEENPNRLVLYGNVDIREVDISFRIDGRVKEVLFDEGDTVKTGDLMLVLDPEPYTDVVQQTTAQIDAAKANYANTEILFKRRTELIGDGSISQEDYDQAYANYYIAKGNLDLSLADHATAMTNLKDTKVFAPTDGWILTRIREPGSVVRATDPVLTLSVKSPVWIRAYVNEVQLGMIYPGMKADVYTDTKGGKVYQGHIGFISPMAEFTPKTVETTQLRTDLVYRLRVYVDTPDLGLRQGMPVTVKLKK